ncbi:tail fiber protein [Vibrio phage vB_ValP_IME271]|nr:tail fiber protein [Vibrio phage vB_ValP_IME271]
MATENGFFTNQTQFQNDPNVSQRDNLKGFYGVAVRPAYIEDLVAKAEEAAANSKTYSDQSKQYRDEAEVIRDQTQVINDQTDQVYNDTVQVYNDTVVQATNAANSAAAAAQSESNAASSETSAANSAVIAAGFAADAEAAFDNFNDQYLGAKPVDPTTDNDGNPLQVGATYWNSTTHDLRFWNGATWDVPEQTATQAANTAVAASDSAQVSATNAANSESAAATSEANALASENAAATSASNAATSESNAATSASNAATSEANAAQSATDAQQSADDAASIVPSLQAQIDNRIDKDTTSLSAAEVDGLFAAGKIEIERTDSNLPGLSGSRSILHMPNGQGGWQLAARSIGSEIHVRAADAGSGTIGPWERIYTTGYKPSATDVGALPDNGTAVAADKWATPRTITVDGDVDGSVTIDGSSNETLNATVNPFLVWKNVEMDVNDDTTRSVYFILAEYNSGGFIGKILTHRRSGNTASFQLDVHAVKQTTSGDNGSYYAHALMTQGDYDVSIVRVTHEGVEKLAVKIADVPSFQKPQRASFFNSAPNMETHEVICVTDDKITGETAVVTLHPAREKLWNVQETVTDGALVVGDGITSKEIKHPDNPSEHGTYLYSSGYTYVTADNQTIELRPRGLTQNIRRWTLDPNGTVIQYHSGGSAFKFRDGSNSGVGSSSFMEWQHVDETRRGYLGYGTAGNNHMTWENTEGGNAVILKDNGRITLDPGTDNTVDMENSALYYGRSYCNAAAGGSWGHASFAATALLNTNSSLAYNVFKMGVDGPKLQALGEGGGTVRLYPGGGSSNFIAYQAHNIQHYYTGTSPMSWDMFAETANVNTSIRMREDGSNHGVEFGYAGASSNNEFFINMRQSGSDNRAMSIYRDRTRAIFNTNRLDVESTGAEKMLLYRSDGDTNVNIRYSGSTGSDVWAGKTTSNFAIGSASDLSSSSNQWMIIGSPAATFRVPVVLEGGSPTGSHAIRRDWAEDNLFRRSVQSVTSQDWNTLYKSGHSSVNGMSGSNRPSTTLTGVSYTYGSLLAMSHTNTNSGVKTQIYFPHNQSSPDASSRLPVYRTGYTSDYGNWRNLLTFQYAENRYAQISSDERLKTDIKEVEGALDLVNQIGSYSYIKENAEVTQIIEEDGEYTGSDEHYRFEMGFLAQEVEKVLPHIVKDDVRGYKAIRSGDNTLLAVAYQAIRELNEENKQLKDRLAAIEAHLGLGE